jgi:branched-chain amino acid transport system substrate-binding protein
MFSFSAFAEIKVGALFSVTGPASFLGLPEKQTLELLVDEANKQGGINGEKIKLIIYDTRTIDAEARKKFIRLVKKDRVDFIVGPTISGSTLAIKELADKFKIPVISCASSGRIVNPVAKYVFKVAPSDYHAVEKVYDFLKSKGKNKVGILTIQNGFGDSGRHALMTIAERMGIEIVADEKFRDSDKDMTSQLTKISKKNPDAIICWAAGSTPAIVAKNFKQLGLKSMLVMSHGVASKKFISLAADASENIYLPAGRLLIADKLADDNKFKKLLINYKKEYEAKYKTAVSPFGGHAYDAFTIIKKVLKSNEKDKIKAIENIKGMIGTYGEFNFSPKDHNGLNKDAFIMLQIKNKNWVLVE